MCFYHLAKTMYLFSNSNYCELYWHIFRVYTDLWPNNYPHNLSPSICGYKKRNVSKPNKGCQTCYCSCLQYSYMWTLYKKDIPPSDTNNDDVK